MHKKRHKFDHDLTTIINSTIIHTQSFCCLAFHLVKLDRVASVILLSVVHT